MRSLLVSVAVVLVAFVTISSAQQRLGSIPSNATRFFDQEGGRTFVLENLAFPYDAEVMFAEGIFRSTKPVEVQVLRKFGNSFIKIAGRTVDERLGAHNVIFNPPLNANNGDLLGFYCPDANCPLAYAVNTYNANTRVGYPSPLASTKFVKFKMNLDFALRVGYRSR